MAAVADTSLRALRLLSLLSTHRLWRLAELAERLGAGERTVRRDIETLRRLDYPIRTVHGPAGGYRLDSAHTLPLQLDDDQALAVAVALQTAPNTVFGLENDAARALEILRQAMPPRLRATMAGLPLTRLRNYWEFAAGPIDTDALKAVGGAVRRHHVLIVEVLRPDGSRPEPSDSDFARARHVEPHHLVVWASRWYLVGFDRTGQRWMVHRVDRLLIRPPTGIPFTPREIPGGDVAGLVMSSHDRGDVPAQWQCAGSARLPLPAEIVARWAPGGSLVEQLDADSCRLTVGAWSWAGIAGILTTFDCALSDVEPAALRDACRQSAIRLARAASITDSDASPAGSPS